MLSDWYFSVCVGHDSKVTTAVMSILRVLRHAAPEPLQLRIAQEELARADVWTRIYALPHLLRAIHRQRLHYLDAEPGLRILSDIVSGIPAAGAWDKLLKIALESETEGNPAPDLERCAEALLRADTPTRLTTPYLDLPSNAASVVWLAVVLLAQGEPGGDSVSELLTRESSASRLLVAAAESGHYGRLPLRLAVLARAAAGDVVTQDQLLLTAEAAGNPYLEPDLVELVQARRVETISHVDTELRTLLLKPWLSAGTFAARADDGEILRRLGISPESLEDQASLPQQLAVCFAHIAYVEGAIRCRPALALECITGGLAHQQAPFWITIRDKVGRDRRYASWNADLASFMMAGVSLSVTDWLEHSVQADVSPGVWLHIAHAADVLSCWGRPISVPVGAIIERSAGRGLDIAEALSRIHELEGSDYATRVSARAAVRFVGWFLQAYRQGVAGRLEQRWVTAASRLADYAWASWTEAQRFGVVTPDEVVEGACIDALFTHRSMDRWAGALLKVRHHGWPRKARELLLGLRPVEQDWYPPDAVPETNENYPLFVATERCAHRGPNTPYDPLKEWDVAFGAVASARIDRLLKFRLIGLLGSRCFDEGREFLIVNAVLAADSPFEIHSTLERVFNTPTAELADRVNQLLVARIEGERERKQQRDFPNPVWVELDRRDATMVCSKWLGRLLVRDATHEEWVARFWDRRALSRAAAGPQCRQLDYTAEFHGHVPVLVPKSAVASGEVAEMDVAAFDVERQQATVFARLVTSTEPGRRDVVAKPGDLAKVDQLRPHPDGSGKPVLLEIAGIPLSTHPGSPSGWFAQSRWLSEPDATQLTPPHWACLQPDWQWVPMIEDRLALLASMRGHDTVTLNWNGESVTTSSGETGWVVDAGSGRRFALGPSDFTVESWIRITDSIASDSEVAPVDALVPDSLLVLRPTEDGLVELIRISNNKLRWLQLFNDEEVVRVRRSGNLFTVEVPKEKRLPGRPAVVSAHWTPELRTPNLRDGESRDAVVAGWDGRISVLELEPIWRNELGGSRNTWPSACTKWQELTEGTPLYVTRILDRPGNPTTRARTAEGFVVNLHEEELFGWDAAVSGNLPGSGRLCHVAYEPSSYDGAVPTLEVTKLEGIEPGRFEQEILKGYVCGFPALGEERDLTVALWPRDTAGPVLATVWISVPQAHRPSLKVGDQIDVWSSRGSLLARIRSRSVMVRPVWTLEESQGKHDQGSQKVRILHKGLPRTATVMAPGRLRLSEGDAAPMIEQGGFVLPSSRENRIPLGGRVRRPRRVVADLGQGRKVCGNIAIDGAWSGPRRWTVIDELQPAAGGNSAQFYLLRTFAPAVGLRAPDGPKRGAVTDQAERELEAALEKLITKRASVAIEVVSSGSFVRLIGLVLPKRDRLHDESAIALREGDGPYVSESAKRRGQAILLRVGGALVASTRSVHDVSSVEEWVKVLIAARVLPDWPANDEEVDLGRMSLYYVGPEFNHPVSGSRYDDAPRYRFEWAPGRCIVVTADQLLFNTDRFENAADQLFFGDKVRLVAFTRSEATSSWRIDLKAIGVVISDSHRLFWQARHWKLVHLVRVNRVEDGNIEIAAVESLDQSRLGDELRSFSMAAEFASDEARVRIAEALGNSRVGAVHGRLDVKAYLDSNGRRTLFDPVALSMGTGGLREGERVLLAAKAITPLPNDYELGFKIPSELLWGVSSPLSVRKRQFSARVDLLGRHFHESRAMEGRRYLVRVGSGKDKGEFRLSIVDPQPQLRVYVPRREQGALIGWLKASGDPPLVTVVDDEPEHRVILEIRPGVFVAIHAQYFRCSAPRPLQYGAILRLSLDTDERVIAVEAMPSDADLVPVGGRFVTLLPMGSPKAVSTGALRFTFASFPGLVARLDPTLRQSEAHAALSHCLAQPHPRFGWLLRPASQAEDLFVLRLQAPQDATIEIRPQKGGQGAQVAEWGSSSPPQLVSWLSLTYADGTGVEVQNTAMTRQWHLHDRQTWGLDGATPRYFWTGPATVATSPIFAERVAKQKNTFRIRYSRRALPRFLYSPRDLCAMLPAIELGQEFHVWVADIDHDRASFLVEAAPGRIHVLPLALLVYRDQQGIEISLSDISLRRFGLGDRLTLGRARGQADEIDRICLINWAPGLRAAMSTRKMLLRLDGVDEKRHATTFGSGAFKLTLPFIPADSRTGDSFIIDNGNSVGKLAVFGTEELHGAGALLCEKDGALAIEGLAGYRCVPDRDYDWGNDPVGQLLFEHDGSTPGPLLHAAGGHVPVTLQYVDEKRHVVFFNRANQLQHLEFGTCPARVLGKLSNKRVVVRLGSELADIGLDSLVAGLPKRGAAVNALVESLKTGRRPVWVRVAKEDVRPGLRELREAGEDGAFLPIAVVEVEDEGQMRVAGLLCECLRSRAVHWLPVDKLGWTDFSRSSNAINRLYVETGRPLHARVLPGGRLSVIGTARAGSDFGSARPGSEVIVRATGQDRHDGLPLVRSVASDVVLAMHGPLSEPEGEFRVVIRHRDRELMKLDCEMSIPGKVWLDNTKEDMITVTAEIELILDLHQTGQEAERINALERMNFLARRAIRHWPRELLMWTNVTRPAGAWLQFRALRSVLLGEDDATKDTNDLLESACRTVELGNWRDDDQKLIGLAAAARALRGDLTWSAVGARRRALFSSRVSELGARISAQRRSGQSLPQDVVDGLQQLLMDLRREEAASGLKLTWGAALPPVSSEQI